jgi:hypothetical protein
VWVFVVLLPSGAAMALKTDNGTLPYCRAVGYVPIKAWRDRGASSLERATKTTVLLEALLDGKAEALTKKAIEMPCSKSEGKPIPPSRAG